MPSIGGVTDIELNNVGYKLSRQPRAKRPIYTREEAPQFVNRNASGDPFYRDATFWSHWVQLTWQNGAKQEFFNDAGRFWKNSATDPTESEKLTLSKNKQTHTQIASRQLTAFGQRNASYRLDAGFSDGGISSYLSGGWVHELACLSGRINRIRNIITSGNANIKFFLPGEVSASGDPTATTGYIMVSGGEPGPLYGAFGMDLTVGRAVLDIAWYNNAFYAGTSYEGRIYKATDVSGSTCWDLDKLIRSSGFPWAMKEYAGYLFIGLGRPYKGTSSDNYNGELWRYDGTNYDLVTPFHWTEVTALEVYNGTLFIGTYHGEIFIYDLASLDKLFDLPGKPRINDFEVFEDRLHIFTDANADGAHWVFDRRGFHRPDGTSARITDAITFQNSLYTSVYDGSTNTDIYFNDLDMESYAPGGTLQTSYFDSNLPSLDKLWKETTLQWDNLPDSTSIKVDYKFDESDSFTTLGTISASASSREYTIPFPSATFSQKLSYQVTLSTSVSTNTPTLRRMITKYRTQPDFYYRWNLGIDSSDKIQYLDGSYATSSGRDFQSKLLTDKRLKSVVQFKDIDYTSAKINGSLAASATTIPIFSDPTGLFPLQGRLRIPGTHEEITYTSANMSAFTGITRGIKKTTPTSAATSATIDNSYRVMFDELNEQQFQLNLLADRIEDVTPVVLLEI